MSYLHPELKKSTATQTLLDEPLAIDTQQCEVNEWVVQVDNALSHFCEDMLQSWGATLRSLPIPLQCALSEDFDKGYRAARLQIARAIVRERQGECAAREAAVKRLRAKRRGHFQPKLPL